MNALLAQISIQTAMAIFWVVLGAVAIFAIAYGVTVFIERKAPATGAWMWIVQIVLVILAAMVAIGIIMDIMGYPVVVRHGP